jgi:RNA-directed DNA polymerase
MKSNKVILKVHDRLEDYNTYYYGCYEDVEFCFNQDFFSSKLLSVVKLPDLKLLLKVSLPLLNELINEPHYQRFQIPKKSGGYRLIQAPGHILMYAQSRLNFYLQNYYHLIAPKGVYGFVINPTKSVSFCNIVENAKIHVNQKYVLNLDLKDFFPSILAYRVKELFQSDDFRFNEKVATALALLVTYEGKLPIGAPTSPVISNFICLELDDMLQSYCDTNKINYSRYADDLTFSSNQEITKFQIHDLMVIISANQFEINKKKTRLKTNSRKQTVTGLVVNEKVNIDRKTIKMVRAMLHDALQNGIAKAAKRHFKNNNQISNRSEAYFMNRLDGYINFIGQVRGKEDALYLKFKYYFKMIHKLS